MFTKYIGALIFLICFTLGFFIFYFYNSMVGHAYCIVCSPPVVEFLKTVEHSRIRTSSLRRGRAHLPRIVPALVHGPPKQACAETFPKPKAP